MNFSALIGNPVNHSVSNYLFVEFAKKAGIEYGHLKIKVDSVNNIESAFNALKILKFKGFNITLPYKIYSLEFLNDIDDSVKLCGAVNTVKINNNKLYGYNTDCYGFISSINLKLKRISNNDRVLILGAGGAARAVISEVCKYTPNVWITNRTIENALKLKEQFSNIKSVLDLRNIIPLLIEENINYVINTTSVGMPNMDFSLINEHDFQYLKSNGFFSTQKYFFDSIFNPFSTKFLTLALNNNAKICGGMYWMIYQGIRAFEIWNGLKLNYSEAEIENLNTFLRSKI